MSRVSTFGMQNAAIAQLMARQSEASRTQLQLATGLKLNTAKDNPVAAGVAIAMQRAEAEYERFGANANMLSNRLTLQENVLISANDIVGRLQELAVQANGGVLSQADREALVPEIAQLREALFSIANSSDGQGRYLFGGTRDGSEPFSFAGGQIQYGGDQTQRRIEVAPGVTVADSDPGHQVFLRIATGANGVAARADAGNTGTATLTGSGFTNQAQWTGGSYQVRFSAGDYEVVDGGGTVVATGPFQPGQAIGFAGYQVTVQGEPADGDAFNVGPAARQDIFTTIDRMIDTLRTPDTPQANKAAMQNGFYEAIENLSRASEHFIDVRAAGGARMATLDRSADEREAQLLSVRSTLSEIRDLDYAEAISRLSREMATLEAAQLSYQRIQSLSLFQMMR